MEAAAEESASKTRPHNRFKRSPRSMEAEANQSILSPRFRSAAAMAGWDEEALLLATLVVEDTPVREYQHKKRLSQNLKSQNLKSPLTSSSSSISRKRRSRRQFADLIPAVVLCLDDDDEVSSHQEVESTEKESEGFVPHEEKKGDIREEVSAEKAGGKGLPCMDQLREELSCAICLEICYEPSTIPCGHSFCKKCLKCAANKCGKTCPKCRQLICNGRLGTVNTILWNTIQLLFPEEVEARKKAVALETSSKKDVSNCGSKLDRILRNIRSRNFRNGNRSSSSSSSFSSAIEILAAGEADRHTGRRLNASQFEDAALALRHTRRRLNASQFEDAALALRLQREEFLEAFRNSRGQRRELS